MNNRRPFVPVLLILLLALASPIQAADLILSSPPRESNDAGEDIFGPLAEHLSELIGTKVVYEHPSNWLKYQWNMRDGKYDIVFDGPHFIAWRIVHLKHDVVVKLPETLEFYLVSATNDSSVDSLDDLIGQRICAIPLPNLSSLTVLEQFGNPAEQPVITVVRGGMPEIYRSFIEGKCKAAVLRTDFYHKKLNKQQQGELKILFHTMPVPNQGFSVSQRVNAAAKEKIVQDLTVGEGAKLLEPLVKRFGVNNAQGFVPARNEEYEGYNKFLEGTTFGW